MPLNGKTKKELRKLRDALKLEKQQLENVENLDLTKRQKQAMSTRHEENIAAFKRSIQSHLKKAKEE